MKKINVLSLFDGISCGQVALKKIKDIKINKYYASEIDKDAQSVTQFNFPNTIQLGDIKNIKQEDLLKLENIDLLLGGFPCQDLSSAGKRNGLSGERSSLFFYYVDILNFLRSKNSNVKFLLENVKGMTKEDKKIIDEYMGVEGFLLDSSIFSPQRRKRYYWTNIEIDSEIFKMKNTLFLKDVLEKNKVEEKYQVEEKYLKTYQLLKEGQYWKDLPEDNIEKIKIINSRKKHKNPGGQTGFWKVYDKNLKSPTLIASGLKQKMTRFIFIDFHGFYRYPTPLEFERLQGLPDNYTHILSDNKRYKVIGNGWNIETIYNILKYYK